MLQGLNVHKATFLAYLCSFVLSSLFLSLLLLLLLF